MSDRLFIRSRLRANTRYRSYGLCLIYHSGFRVVYCSVIGVKNLFHFILMKKLEAVAIVRSMDLVSDT